MQHSRIYIVLHTFAAGTRADLGVVHQCLAPPDAAFGIQDVGNPGSGTPGSRDTHEILNSWTPRRPPRARKGSKAGLRSLFVPRIRISLPECRWPRYTDRNALRIAQPRCAQVFAQARGGLQHQVEQHVLFEAAAKSS